MPADLASAIRKYLGMPVYHKFVDVARNFAIETDGSSLIVNDFVQRYDDVEITFLDASRFLQEAQDQDCPTPRLPALVNFAVSPKRKILATTSPLALEIGCEESTLQAVLSELSMFTTANNDYAKFPMFVHRYDKLTLGTIFGKYVASYRKFVNSLRRFGPGELVLEALQLNAQKRYLTAVSQYSQVKYDAAPDELDALITILEVNNYEQLASLMNLANAISILRFAECTTPQADSSGFTTMMFYARLDPNYLYSLPYDVIKAFSAPDTDGNVVIKTIAGESIPVLHFRLPPHLLQMCPAIASMTHTDWNILCSARQLYRALIAARFLEIRGYVWDDRVQIKSEDHRGFLQLIT